MIARIRTGVGAWRLAVGLLLGIASVGFEGSARGQEEVSAALRDRVAQLVERLGDDDEAERQRAEEALIELGPRVLSLLETPEGAEANVEERLGRIREAIEEAGPATNLGPSRITMDAREVRLSEVLRELQRQSGNRLTDLREIYGQDAANPALDLEIVDLPFLEALDRVAEDAGLSTVFFTGDGTIGLLNAEGMGAEMYEGGGDVPTVYPGPFRVTLDQVAAQHDLATGARSANVRMVVCWEPRLRPMLLSLDVSDIAIVDDRGETVEPAVTDETGTVVLRPENPAAEFNLNMTAPDRMAQRLARVKVAASVTVPAANEVFRLDLAEPTSREKQGEVSVSLGGVEVDGYVWKVDVEVAYSGNSEAFETYRQGLFNNRIWLQRPDGSRFDQNGGFNQIGGTDSTMAFQYLFVDAPGAPADYQLVYETPGKIETIPLEFEFEDVPLP